MDEYLGPRNEYGIPIGSDIEALAARWRILEAERQHSWAATAERWAALDNALDIEQAAREGISVDEVRRRRHERLEELRMKRSRRFDQQGSDSATASPPPEDRHLMIARIDAEIDAELDEANAEFEEERLIYIETWGTEPDEDWDPWLPEPFDPMLFREHDDFT